jgi:putative RNA 2'-phosphotransferase
MEELEEVVATNTKKRFSFNEDKTKIKANQGHSIKVDLALQPKQPPSYLYHGTVEKFLQSIREKGLIKGSRHHVHLSADKETAINVGSRRGKPIILTIKSGEMHAQNHIFYQSENGVWLTETVPTEYIEF